MGWLSMPLAGMGGHRTAKAYLDAQCTYDRADEHGHHRGLTVLASRCPGMGEVILHGEELYVQVAQAILGPDRCVLFRRVRGRDDYCGLTNHWASIGELLAPERLAARIVRELGLTAPAPAAATLFA